MLGTFMEVLDTTVVNVALPHIAGSLAATVDESTWVLTSYLVSNAIILPITGWLANHFGRKRILMISVTGFTLSSVACGMAPNLAMLIIFRIVQGATGGGLQPLSQAIMLESFRPQDRGKAMAFWALGIVVAPMLGPVLGGWITDTYSWRWVFYINLPIGIFAMVMAQLFIFDPPYIRRQSERVDYWGFGMLVVGMAALQIMLDKGQTEDWFESDFIRWLALLAVAGLVAFCIRELKTSHPIVNLRIFRNRTYATGVFMMTVLGFVLYGSIVLVPVWLQTLMGYPALQAGMAMLPRGVGSFLFMPLIGLLITRIEPRKLLFAGYVLAGLSLVLLGQLSLDAGYWDIFWPQILQGVAMSMCFVPLTTTYQRSFAQGGDGQRHQHLQPDAQHRRQHRNRFVDDPGGARPAAQPQRPGRACQRLEPRHPHGTRVGQGPGHLQGRRRRYRYPPGLRHRLRLGAAARGHARVHQGISLPGIPVLHRHPADPADAQATARRARSRGGSNGRLGRFQI